jgi:hypothetical protein
MVYYSVQHVIPRTWISRKDVSSVWIVVTVNAEILLINHSVLVGSV